MGERVQNAEIAFFGGSFTAIDPDYRLALLKTAHAACETYGFAGIRCSTRPDAIDDERLTVLKQYGVTAIELGAQSMDGEVLLLNRRGHTAKDVENAARLIRAYDFELGLQMMTGLPGDSDAKTMKTVERLLALKPNTIRKLRLMLTRACFPLRSDRKKKICSISLSTATPCTSARMLRFPAAHTGYDRQVNRCF